MARKVKKNENTVPQKYHGPQTRCDYTLCRDDIRQGDDVLALIDLAGNKVVGYYCSESCAERAVAQARVVERELMMDFFDAAIGEPHQLFN